MKILSCKKIQTQDFNPQNIFLFSTPNSNLQEYLNCTVQLCAPGTAIPPGRHQFPLRVMIPSSAPSSFDSQFGAIRYSVRVILLTNSEQVGPTFLGVKRALTNQKFLLNPTKIPGNRRRKFPLLGCCFLLF